MATKGEVVEMVLIKTLETKDFSHLKIRRTIGVRNKKNRSNTDTMILLHVTDMAGGTLVSV